MGRTDTTPKESALDRAEALKAQAAAEASARSAFASDANKPIVDRQIAAALAHMHATMYLAHCIEAQTAVMTGHAAEGADDE